MDEFISTFSNIWLFMFFIFCVFYFFSYLSNKVSSVAKQQENKKVLEEFETSMKAKRARQEKTLQEIALYPKESDDEKPTWLFLDAVSYNGTLVEVAWIATDEKGLLVDDWHGLPTAEDYEKILAITAETKALVMFNVVPQRTAIAAEMRKLGRDDLAASWLQTKTIDICKRPKSLEQLLGELYLEDEDAPVRGLDNAEARALIVYRCFIQMKIKGLI